MVNLLKLIFFWGMVINLVNGEPILEKNRFQSIAIGNEGMGVIENISILYGKIQLINGPTSASYQPEVGIYGYETLTAPIPAIIKISWNSADGLSHSIAIIPRELIKDLSRFYGFKFIFKDEVVDVYITERIPSNTPYIKKNDIKVMENSLPI